MSQLAYKQDYLTLYTKDSTQDAGFLSWTWTLPQAYFSQLRQTGAWVSLVQHSPVIDTTSLPTATVPAYVVEYDGGFNNFSTNNTGGTLAIVTQGTPQLTSAESPKVFVSSCPDQIKIRIRLPATGAIAASTGGGSDVDTSVFILRFEYLPQEEMRLGQVATYTPLVIE
jgi:hypothetical protein